ncbi:MAG TPA: serine/threonine-protein kinase [Vicinamibacterales bacterium]|nr:serine/threonine-protein kinase [Vicinamibacterales bacterium]
MTPGAVSPEDRRRVNDLFHRALELPAVERADFVRRASEGSDVVANEVLSLLQAHEQPDQILDAPLSPKARELAEAAAKAAALVGQQLGQYRVDRILGQGGMGVVYEAWDSDLNRIVAMKCLSPDTTRDPARRERLKREARAGAAFNHPGIATVYTTEEFDGDLFLVSEFVPGETLRDEVARGPVEPARLLQTAIELAQALGAAHDHGVIHRDLKPENVIRMPNGHVKILDFGLARLRDAPPGTQTLTVDGQVFGTPAYMAPEQLRREPVDARSDLFSLGVMLYELLFGEHPFGGADPAATIVAIVESEPRWPRASGEVRASGALRTGLEEIIHTLLRKTPAARFRSAHELAAALERTQTGRAGGPVLQPVAPNPDALRWWTFHQAATCAFYVLLLIPIGFAGQLLGDDIGVPLFLAALVVVVGAVTLRGHLWFTANSMPDEFDHQYVKTARWVRMTDWILVTVAAGTGVAVYRSEGPGRVYAVILLIGAVTSLIASAVIEPATSRAAFGRKSAD